MHDKWERERERGRERKMDREDMTNLDKSYLKLKHHCTHLLVLPQ